MLRKTRIRRHERGLWFRHGDFQRLLQPGAYRVWSRLWSLRRDRIEILDTLDFRFEHDLLDVLVGDADLASALVVVDLAQSDRALVWKDGRLAHVLGPGRHAFWRAPYQVRVDRFDAEALRFEHERRDAILAHPEAKAWLTAVTVGPYEEVLLLRSGRLVDRLREGRHAFWTGVGDVTWNLVDLREQTLDVAGQEIMTADKVTLRVNLVVTYRVTDPVKAVTAVRDAAAALYREAQLVLRAAVGARGLDGLLADKESLGGEIRAVLAGRADEIGVAVRSVGLRDVILPGDMKEILNQVIQAQKQAEANLIRRREETAAARSQANTARLLDEHPRLARMKELEVLQEVLAGAKATFVFGPGDLLEQVRGLAGEHP